MIGEVTKEFRFEAAHRLMKHPGKCKNLHGHSYKVVLTVTGNVDSSTGMVVDLGHLSQAVSHIFDSGWLEGKKIVPFDHSTILHEEDPLLDLLSSFPAGEGQPLRLVVTTNHPTAEYLCELIGAMIDKELGFVMLPSGITPGEFTVQDRPFVSAIQVWETEDFCASAEWGEE